MFPLVTLTDDRRRRCARVVRNAIREADMTLDRAALEAERNARQVARQIDGEEGSLTTLYQQPDEFWREFGLSILVEFGLSKRARLAARLRQIVIGRQRQLRVTHARKAERAS